MTEVGGRPEYHPPAKSARWQFGKPGRPPAHIRGERPKPRKSRRLKLAEQRRMLPVEVGPETEVSEAFTDL